MFPCKTVIAWMICKVENARQDLDLFLDNHPRSPLLLDEIQYAPELVAAIKRRVDRDRRPGNFILVAAHLLRVQKGCLV